MQSPMEYDVIVIGTGIGGSVASAILSAEGLKVLMLEKNKRIGGVCSYYEKDGFKVDIGTHMFSRGASGPLGALARRVGATPIPFVQTRDLCRVVGFGGDMTVPRDLRRMPGFLWSAARQLKLSPKEMTEAARFFWHIMRIDEAKLAELDRITMWEFMLRFTKNPKLMGIFGLLLGLYFILPLKSVSAGEGIWCFRRMAADHHLSYPLGGSVTVPETFVNAAMDRGATLRTEHTVSRVRVHKGAVQGVECADGSTFEAPVVVSTASLRDQVEKLVGVEHFPEAYVHRVRSLTSSMIAVQAKIALKRPLVEAGCIVGGVSDVIDLETIKLDDFDDLYNDVAAGRLTRITPIYAPVPTNFDPSLAPRGAQLITACAVAPTTDVTLQDSPKAWTENLMKAMAKLIPGLERELLWVDTMSTRALEGWMGKSFAPAVSTGQTPDQVGNRRPPVHTPVLGLYACGCNAGARGVGTELAAASAAEAADRVVQDLSNGLISRPTTRVAVRKKPKKTRQQKKSSASAQRSRGT